MTRCGDLIYEQILKEINIISLTFAGQAALSLRQYIGEESPDTIGQHSG